MLFVCISSVLLLVIFLHLKPLQTFQFMNFVYRKTDSSFSKNCSISEPPNEKASFLHISVPPFCTLQKHVHAIYSDYLLTAVKMKNFR